MVFTIRFLRLAQWISYNQPLNTTIIIACPPIYFQEYEFYFNRYFKIGLLAVLLKFQNIASYMIIL